MLPIPPWIVAVVVSILASAFTVMGFVLQKQALREPHKQPWPQIGSVVVSPGWVAGFLLTAIFPIAGDLVAYSLAPLSLTAPLSGVSVVLNMVIAPWALSEQLQLFPDVPATALILFGCCLTTSFGDHASQNQLSAVDLCSLATQPLFMAVVFMGTLWEFILIKQMRQLHEEMERLAIRRQQNPHLPHVLRPAIAAALCGAAANIGLKAISELIRWHGFARQVLFCGVLVLPAALFQVNFINRGLCLYPQSVFMSVYGAVLVLSNTFFGAIFYREYVALLSSASRFMCFSIGCVLILAGISLFKYREHGGRGLGEDSTVGASATCEEQTSLHLQDPTSQNKDDEHASCHKNPEAVVGWILRPLMMIMSVPRPLMMILRQSPCKITWNQLSK